MGAVSWPRSGMMRAGTTFPLPSLTRRPKGLGIMLTPERWTDWAIRIKLLSLWRNYILGHHHMNVGVLRLAGFSTLQVLAVTEWMMGYPEGWTDPSDGRRAGSLPAPLRPPPCIRVSSGGC